MAIQRTAKSKVADSGVKKLFTTLRIAARVKAAEANNKNLVFHVRSYNLNSNL